jgi:hypothetical protein
VGLALDSDGGADALGLTLASGSFLPPAQATRANISAAIIDKLSHFFMLIPLYLVNI